MRLDNGRPVVPRRLNEAMTTETREKLKASRLYVLITESVAGRPLVEVTRRVIEGGADILQLREKELTDREYLDTARRLCAMAREAGRLFIVNDRVAIAKLAGADGVHLGQEDLPVRAARRIVGDRMLIGVSTHDIGQARQAVADGADYIGVGPVYPTRTRGYETGVGTAYVREVLEAGIALPFFAIGSITLENLAAVTAAGASRVAVSSAIIAAQDIVAVASEFARRLHGRR